MSANRQPQTQRVESRVQSSRLAVGREDTQAEAGTRAKMGRSEIQRPGRLMRSPPLLVAVRLNCRAHSWKAGRLRRVRPLVSEKGAEVRLHQGRSSGQIRTVVMEVDGVGHGAPLMTEELSAVLRGNDPDRMGREAVAQHLDRHVWQPCSSQHGLPRLAETVERSS